jgi:hypothetical protein
MFSSGIILSAIVLIIFFIISGSYIKPGKNTRRDIPRKKEAISPKDEIILSKDKTTFSSHQKSPQKTNAAAVCKTCNDSKRIKCTLCLGFGSTRITRFVPPTTIQVPKTKTVYEAKGRATLKSYMENQFKPGKYEYINQPCGRCLGSGKVKCPDC